MNDWVEFQLNDVWTESSCIFSYSPIGITPMLQIISAVIKDAGDNTNLNLLFANQVKV